MIWLKRLLLLIVILLVGAAIVYAFMPQPVHVDVGTVEQGPMELAVGDDGKTRLRDRYVVSTPISGRLQRIDLEAGDPVVAGETIIARMVPKAPELLDPRDVAQAQARVLAAEGRLKRAKTELERTNAALEQAKTELRRQHELHRDGAGTQAQLENAQLVVRTTNEDVRAAEFQTEIAAYEMQMEKAALLHVSQDLENINSDYEFEITSPITGRVLRVMQESSAVLAAGAALLELGDPTDLEVVVDVLSTDAVKIRPGQRVKFEHWGGEAPLQGTVRLVEPSGFTKISALGVEEQRVNVIIDFVGSLRDRLSIGDGYRVEARIVIWEESQATMVPSGALFRDGDGWAVFAVVDGHARLRRVTIGKNNGLQAQVLEGLQAGEEVILYPSDEVTDGVAIVRRNL